MSWFPFIAAALLAITWIALELWRRIPPKLNLPVVGSPTDQDLSKALVEGYKKYPDAPFIIPTDPPRVMLPISLLDEVMHAPTDQISFFTEVYERFLGRFTGVGTERHEITHAVRMDLTKNMAEILPLLQDESRFAFEKELGAPADWTTIPLYPTLLRLVALLSGRVFVGKPLCRDQEWLGMSIGFTVDLVGVLRAGVRWNSLLRPIVAPFLPEVRKVANDLRKSAEWMRPLVAEAIAVDEKAEGGAAARPGDRFAFVAWMLGRMPNRLKTAERIGTDQMLTSFAAIHTTSSTGAMVLMDLASRPEYIKSLREEVEEVINEDGEQMDEHGNTYLTKASISKLRKLDSFIKESQRCNPLSFNSGNRRLLKDYTFSNGLRLPQGTSIGFPSWAVAHSTTTALYSPEYNAAAGNPGPEVFDGFRYARLRTVPGRETKHQAVTTGSDSLTFGHGPHACPGRFFAVYEIKVLVLDFLRRYDFRIAGDVEGKGGAHLRPKNIVQGIQCNPNPRALFEIRKRQD